MVAHEGITSDYIREMAKLLIARRSVWCGVVDALHYTFYIIEHSALSMLH